MTLLFWHWFVIGLVLLIVEVLLPTGFFLIFIGAAALFVGALAWVLPIGWEAQLVLFGVLSIASFFAWRRVSPGNPVSDQPSLNRRGHSYVGRTFTLGAPIVNGIGTLHVDDSQWRIAGPDVAAGTRVRVTAVQGTTLTVQPAE